MATKPLYERILSTLPISQGSCPLFGILPGELRSQIFSLALIDFPDPSPEKHYEADTCYTQRAPPEYDVDVQLPRLRSMLQRITQQHGGKQVEIECLRVFAQIWMLEEDRLAALLKTPDLHPRILTLTIRHADWWWWEADEPLRLEGNWIEGVCAAMSSSVHEVRIELESLERKKDQVDAIAKQMIERWFFKRKDGVVLYPNSTGSEIEIDRWTGTSKWHGHTWRRDETRPDQIDYYIASVIFRPARLIERGGGRVSGTAQTAAETDVFNHSALRLRYMARPANISSQALFDNFEGDEDDSWNEEMDEDEGNEDNDEDEENSEPENNA
ncbi:hypothetical protein B0H67DRAFT_650424 [Lasiosphaeris hirsuta]|uniref:Uncharacterized protein n=1 Tax=Lasiosphaeris hirsuta TaxID=260670 RepID=A0AA39ZRR1_9PEZI|nr:hypothetical protein B0H67DRAFT_650424 [Lasiosphaeris hirsuta]